MESAVGIIGDFNPSNKTHIATNKALEVVGLSFEWLPTTDLERRAEQRLATYHGLWIAPASPYRSMTGALTAVQYAREEGVPLIGT